MAAVPLALVILTLSASGATGISTHIASLRGSGEAEELADVEGAPVLDPSEQEVVRCLGGNAREDVERSAPLLKQVLADPDLVETMESMERRTEPVLAELPMVEFATVATSAESESDRREAQALADQLRQMRDYPVREAILQHDQFQSLPKQTVHDAEEVLGAVQELFPDFSQHLSRELPKVKALTRDPKLVSLVRALGDRVNTTKSYTSPEAMSDMLKNFTAEVPEFVGHFLPKMRQQVSESVSMLQKSASHWGPFGSDENAAEDAAHAEMVRRKREEGDEDFFATTTREYHFYQPNTMYHRMQGGAELAVQFACSEDFCFKLIFKVVAVKLGTGTFKGKEGVGPGFFIFPVGFDLIFPEWQFHFAGYVPKYSTWKGEEWGTFGGRFKAVKSGFEVGFTVKDFDMSKGEETKVTGAFFVATTPGTVAFRTDRTNDEEEPARVLVVEPMINFKIVIPSGEFSVGWLQRAAVQTKYGGHQGFMLLTPMAFKTDWTNTNTSWYPTGVKVGLLYHLAR